MHPTDGTPAPKTAKPFVEPDRQKFARGHHRVLLRGSRDTAIEYTELRRLLLSWPSCVVARRPRWKFCAIAAQSASARPTMPRSIAAVQHRFTIVRSTNG